MSDHVNPLVAFFHELVRRRVLHALLVYGGGGFVLLEATSNLVDALGLPHALEQFVAIAVLLGFPVAMVLAWVYERTPDGLRRAPPSELGRGLRRAFAGSLVAGTVLLGFGVVHLVGGSGQGAGPAAELPEPPDAPVLAVLPFQTVGGPGAEDIAPVLEAQIERVLSESHGLRVRWRGALRPLLDQGIAPDSIARRLAIDYFVRAQLARRDSAVVVVVQLVDARTMDLLVSGEVDVREEAPAALLERVTARMEDILRPRLGRDVRLRQWRAETADSVAFRLRWRAFLRTEEALGWAPGEGLPAAELYTELQAADSLLVLALRHDPDWRDILLDRARIVLDQMLVAMVIDSAEELPALYARGRACVDRALELQPDDSEALALRGRLLWRRHRFLPEEPGADDRVDSAETDLRRALDRDPENAVAAATLAELLYVDRQRWEEAYHHARRAYRLDAYQRDWNNIIQTLGRSAFEMGEDSTALRWCREGLSRNPTPPHHACILRVLAWGNAPVDPEEAWRHYDGATADFPLPDGAMHPFFGYVVAGALARAGLPDSARAVLRRSVGTPGPPRPPYTLGLEAGVRFRLGERDAALRLLDELARRDPEMAAEVSRGRVLREYLEPGLRRVPG